MDFETTRTAVMVALGFALANADGHSSHSIDML